MNRYDFPPRPDRTLPLPLIFGNQSGSARDQILSVLRAVRRHLAMDVGFISEFVAGNRVFRFADGDTTHGPVVVGGHAPLEQSFCDYVAKGLMPGLMQDAAAVGLSEELEFLALRKALRAFLPARRGQTVGQPVAGEPRRAAPA